MWIPESVRFLLVESEIRELVACEIWNPGLWNPEYNSRNPESYKGLESRIQVPLTKTGISRRRRTSSFTAGQEFQTTWLFFI